MKGFTILGFWLLACVVVSACTSSPDDDAVPPVADGSTSPPDADSSVPSEAGPSDVAAPKPVEVNCKGDPCYVAVSGNGGSHFCGLLHDGTVRCWGRNTPKPTSEGEPADGALGRGGDVSLLEGATPATVAGLTGVTQISVGPNLGTCARTSDGSVYCWGRNEYGQLGRPPLSEPRLLVPTRVEGIPPVDEVALGSRIGCAVSSVARVLYCWGDTYSGVLDGLGVDSPGWDTEPPPGMMASTFVPQIARNFPSPVKALAIGSVSELADTVVGQLDNDVLASIGEQALSTATSVQIGPQWPRPLEVSGASRVWAFAYYTTDGLIRQWQPSYGLLNIPSRAEIVDVKISPTPRQYPATEGTTRAGGALLSTGRLFRWGYNDAGAAGVDPQTAAVVQHPVEITQLENQVVSFATTAESTCASLVDGTVKCLGSNAAGELGRGTVDADPHPEAEAIR